MPVIRGEPSQLHVSVQGLFLSAFYIEDTLRIFSKQRFTTGKPANKYLTKFFIYFN